MSAGRRRLLGWALLLALVAVAVAQMGGLSNADDLFGFNEPLARARAAEHVASHARDSVRTVAAEARKENVVARRKYTDAKAVLPPAFVKVFAESASIHINTETFTVARPVAEYVLSLQKVIALADTAFVAADTALAKTVEEVAAADTVSAKAEDVIAVLQEKPSFLSRLITRAKLPAAFLAGVLIARGMP